MLNKDFIVENIDQLIDGYLANPNTIKENYKDEIANQEEYRGREILELLQNAVDELTETKKDIKIEFDSNTKILRVSNNGNIFTESGFISLMYSKLSPKYDNSKYIGNKGTGFKSTLNWADEIKIFSGELSIKFSKETAIKKFKQLLSDKYKNKNEKLKKFCETYNINEIAILRLPEYIEKPQTDYDTVIELKIKNAYIDDVIRQIELINSKTILFLKKLEKLEVVINNKEKIYYRYEKILNKNNNIKQVTVTSADEKVEWIVLEENGQLQVNGEKKLYSISIGYNEKEKNNINPLYCFFKTSIQFPIGFLVSATVDLDSGREHLLDKEYNIIVIKKIFNLCIALAKYFSEEKADYTILNLLAPKSDFDFFLKEKNIDNFYYNLLKEEKIFPNVNNQYIKIDHNTKYYLSTSNCVWSDCLYGQEFNNLLKSNTNKNIENLLLKLLETYTSKKYYYYELCCKINNSADLYKDKIELLAQLCKFFIQDYENELKNTYSIKPKIILDSNNELVDSNNIIFIPPSNKEDFNLPSFSKIIFISSELLACLKKEFQINDVIALAQKLNPLNIKRYDLDEIIRQLFFELSNQPKDENCFTKNIEAIKWLFDIYKTKNIDFKNPNLKNIIYLLPNKKNILTPSTKLYLSASYDETLMESLLSNDEFFVCDYSVFNLQIEQKENFKNFLLILGVAKTPRKIKQEIFAIPSKYSKLLNNSEIRSLEVITYEHIENILKNAETKNIINWILLDAKAKAYITTKESDEIGYKQSYYKSYYHDKLMPSWLNYIFSESEWIDIGNKRVSPKQCTIKNIGNIMEPYLYEIKIEKFIKDSDIEQKDETMSFLKSLKLIDEYWKLDSESIYAILMSLANKGLDTNGKYTKSIYNSMLQEEFYHTSILKNLDKNGINRKNFLQNGKVFCKNGKFTFINNAKYLSQINPSKTIIIEQLIDIPPRKNTKFIQEFLGVCPLSLEYNVTQKEIANINTEFQQDFENFKQFASIYRKDYAKIAEVNSIKGLTIFACNNVKISINNEEALIDKYAYVVDDLNKNNIYINIGDASSLLQLKSDISFADAIANIMLDIMKISQTNLSLSSWLRNLYQKNDSERLMNIRIDFPDYDLEDENEKIINLRKDQLKNIVSESLKDFPENLLDNINYLNLNGYSNLKTIEEILEKTSMSVEDLNNKTSFGIDFSEYNNYLISEFISKNKINYKNALYANYADLGLSKTQFLEEFNRFCTYQPTIKEPIGDINKLIETDFPLLKQCNQNLKDVNEIYKTNRSNFYLDKDKYLCDKFLENRENDSLLYFDNFDELNKLYDLFTQYENDKKNKSEEILSSENKVIYSICQIKTSNIDNANLKVASNHTNVQNRMKNSTHDRDNTAWGAKAEEMVFDSMLANPDIYKNVKWISENAKKAMGNKNNPDGKEGMGYDIEYEDENRNKVLVEVKSTKGKNIDFYITQHELEMAEKNSKNYKVIIVVDIEENPNIYDLGFIFDYKDIENRFKNSKFTLFADRYSIRCTEVVDNDKSTI